jgi:beta-N-acetylhexosaminidase
MQIESFSNEQMAGQRLMVGFDGTDLNADLKFLIDTIKVGGIILFSRNLVDPAQIRQLCKSVQEYAESKQQPPLLIAIDQEGGQVARLKEPFTQFPGNPHLEGEEDAARFARITAFELAEIGVNMNMAPVMDVATEEIEFVMADRVFGHDPDWVSTMGTVVIDHMQKGGIMAVAKHFPGIGRTNLDSHIEMPQLNIDLATLESSDLVPFEAAVKHKVAGIMLSHVLYVQIDSEWPASLSPTIAKDLLRDQIGFDGIVLTDDLDMGAMIGNYDIKVMMKQILSADIDITLICHRSPKIERAFEEILKAISYSAEAKAKAVSNLERIIRLKKKYKLSAHHL